MKLIILLPLKGILVKDQQNKLFWKEITVIALPKWPITTR